MKKICYPLVLLFFATQSFGQIQIFELMERNDISLQDAKIIAQKHFDTAGTGQGTGYKQFQRWLYERQFHVDENGSYVSTATDWNNYLSSSATNPSNLIQAGNWTELGPVTWNRTSSWNPGTGRLTAIAIHPSNEQIIYAGSPGGGMWKTINGGTTWTPLMDNSAVWTSIFSITIDPVDQNIVYAGTNGNGLIKSLNGGTTWANTGSGPTGNIRKILIHPSAPNTVFACAGNGIFRSTNGGTNWTQVHSSSKEDIEFKPGDMNIMYASGNDVYRSVNNGVTWTQVGAAQGITNTGRTLVAVSAANPNYVYAVQAAGSLFGRMYKSTDAGLTFTTTVVGSPAAGTNYFGYETNGTGTTGQATYDMGMDVSPTNAAEVYIAGIICWKSTNEATGFTAITAWSLPNSIGYNHADVHGLFWVNSTIYSISDGGLFKSIDQGDNWTDITAGMGIRQFYRIANSQTNANVITGGAQDNGSVARQASATWVDWLGADGMEGLVSPTNHLNIWGTSQNGSIYRSTNGGNSYSGLPKPSNGNWVTPLCIHPTIETIVYGGWTGVYKSTNSGSAWTNISAGTITSTVTDMAIAPSAPTTIYATIGSTIYVTTNDGANWITRSAPAAINDIVVDPTNPSKIWIVCNSSTNRVFVSIDGGANFTNISFNLPNIVGRTIAVDNGTPRGIYVGMNIGVFYQQEGATTWTNFSDNLPMVAINELEIQYAAGKIRVATYGRGVWESPLQTAVPTGFSFITPPPAVSGCPAPATMSITLGTNSIGGFSNPITLTATAGVPAGTNITFGTNPVTPGNSTVVNLNNANSLTAGTYVITITGTATGATAQTVNLTYTITGTAGPVITVQPAAQAVCAGNNTSFSITAGGATGFRWQLSTAGAGGPWIDVTNGGLYSGANTATLNIAGVTAGMNAYQYRCVASIVCGSTNSSAAVLTVNTAPVITSGPNSATVCGGGPNSACFSITATGSNLTYQWQVNTTGCITGVWTNLVNGAPYTGVNTATMCITNATVLMNGYAYRCQVVGTCTPAVTSNCVVLNVNTPVSITAQPVSSTVCAGANTSFTVTASGTNPTYQWQESTNAGANWNTVTNGGVYSGATTPTLTLTGVTAGMSAYQYRVIVNGVLSCGTATSAAVILTVQTAPVLNSSPISSTVYTGSPAAFSVSASGTGLVYQWQISTNGCSGSWTNMTNQAPYSGVTTNTLSINPANGTMSGYGFRCVVSGTCAPSINSGCGLLTVNVPVTIVTQPAVAIACSGSNAGFTVIANGTTPAYQWQESTNAGITWNNISNGGVYSGATSSTLNLTAVPASMNGFLYRVVITGAAPGGTVTSGAAVLNITPLPVITASLNALVAGQQSVLTVNIAPSPGLSFAWYLNGVLVAGATGNSLIATVNSLGNYSVIVSSATGSCQSAFKEISADPSTKLFVFPSPNNGNFTVSYYAAGASVTNQTTQGITIYDTEGRMVLNKEYPVTQPYQLHAIDMRRFGTGLYYIVLREANGNTIKTGEVVIR
ncbi:MAG: T9SS type A sorting domain-containing protein [Chitinophagaceae bacterium]|nr:T9SS type A sorting domain-containing protein [Chitinophagaceae bacterium]